MGKKFSNSYISKKFHHEPSGSLFTPVTQSFKSYDLLSSSRWGSLSVELFRKSNSALYAFSVDDTLMGELFLSGDGSSSAHLVTSYHNFSVIDKEEALSFFGNVFASVRSSQLASFLMQLPDKGEYQTTQLFTMLQPYATDFFKQHLASDEPCLDYRVRLLDDIAAAYKNKFDAHLIPAKLENLSREALNWLDMSDDADKLAWNAFSSIARSMEYFYSFAGVMDYVAVDTK